MNCDQVAALLAADVDGELDRLRSHAMGRHVAGCATCAPRYQAAVVLRARLRTELPRYRAPEALRARMQAGADGFLPPEWPWRPTSPALATRWRWFGSGLLSGGVLAAGVWMATLAWQDRLPGTDISAQVVGLHTRALLGNHLIDVASSDRHKLRPWLSARLDYAVPVLDAAAAGYPLSGARLDQLDGQPVAALVYRRRDHVIDVFVRPAAPGASAPVTHSVRGFNVAAAVGGEMVWLAASDLAAGELSAFVKGLASGTVTPPSE